MNSIGRLYDFTFRGLLAEEALDNAGRRSRRLVQFQEAETARILSLDLLDDQHVSEARAMANVCIAVAALKNLYEHLYRASCWNR